MKQVLLSLILICTALFNVSGQQKMELYLLIGQSNMAGRGELEAQDTIAPDRVFSLSKDLKWVPAKDPIHFDKSAAGTGLGRTFGIELAKVHPDAIIGLIPCAVGGTSIDAWSPGAFDQATKTHPWDDMLKRVQFALPFGEIKGILWHQGESDSNPSKYVTYGEKLTDLILRTRQLTGNQNTPFICGELGQFFLTKVRKDGAAIGPADEVMKTTKEVVSRVGHAAFVSSKGLIHKGDNTHFDSKSVRELGRRYAKALAKIK